MAILLGARLAKNGVHSVDLKKKYLATNNRVVSRYDKNYESGNGLADFWKLLCRVRAWGRMGGW